MDLRVFVESRVEALGLRAAARTVGVSPDTLRQLIQGEVRAPQAETRRKLETWFWHVCANDPAASDGGGEIAALRYLVRSLPEPQRTLAAAEVLRAVEEAYAARRQPLPWPAPDVRAAFGVGR